MKLRVRHLQLAVLVAALSLAAIRFAGWSEHCRKRADAERDVAQRYSSFAAMHRNSLAQHRKNLWDYVDEIDQIVANLAPMEAAEEDRLRDVERHVTSDIDIEKERLDYAERRLHYREKRALLFDRACWMPWVTPLPANVDPSNPDYR